MKYFDTNGEIESYGMMTIDSMRVGKWFKILDRGYEDSYEYLIIDGKEYLNQQWRTNENKDTVSGNFVHIFNLNDTLIIDSTYVFKFYLRAPFFSYDSEIRLIYSEEFNMNFKNVETANKDTIYNLKRTKPLFGGDSLPANHMLEFELNFRQLGDTNFRAIIEEIDYGTNENKIRAIYIDKNIYVKGLN